MFIDFFRCTIASFGLVTATVFGFQARAQVSAPLVGLIAGESPSQNEVRPVLGVLGASSIQAPILLPRDVLRIYLAPTGGRALVQQRGSALGLVTFTGSLASAVQPIAGAAPDPDMVRFSPLGRSAAVLAKSGVVQVLTGLDATPQVDFQVNFHDPSDVKKITVSDDGGLVMILTAAGQVYMTTNAAVPLLAYSGVPSVGISFLPDQVTGLIADGGNGTVSLASITNGVPFVRTAASGVSFPNAETMVEGSRDGTAAFVVASGATSAWRINLANGSPQMLTLPAVATRLDRLRDGNSFVFSAEPRRSAWFLTGDNSGLHAVFAVLGDAAGGSVRAR